MGLFGSSKKTEVNTSVNRVVDDQRIPDTAKRSVISAVLEEERVSEVLVENVLNGPALRVERMYRYGKDHYHYGLPNARILTNTPNNGPVIAVIEQALNQSIELDYLRYAPINITHLAWQALVESHGYNHITNTIDALTQSIGHTVYLNSIVAVYDVSAEQPEPETDALEVWGPSSLSGYTPERVAQTTDLGRYLHSAAIRTEVDGVDHAEVHYVWKEGTTIKRGMFTLPVAGYDKDREYYQARYLYTSNGVQKVGYWTYMDGAGTHPAVDAQFDLSFTNPGTYFPFVFFRHHDDNRTAAAYHGTQAYETSAKLMKILGMDYQELGDAIHENEDVEDIEQAVMLMAIPANSTHQLDLWYLFEFFHRLYEQTPKKAVTLADMELSVDNSNVIAIADQDMVMALSYRGISRKTVKGVIGSPGTFSSATGKYEVRKAYQRQSESGWETRYRTIDVPQRKYRKQINSQFYVEVVVDDPQMKFDIYKDYSHVGKYKDAELIIPLDKALTDKLELLDKEKIYFRSLHFVFNSRITTKVKWYETGFFKAVLIVAAVAITIITGFQAAATIKAAIAVGTVMAVAEAIFFSIVVPLVISMAARLVVREIGPEAGFLVALTAAVISAGMGATNMDALAGLTASQLLAASTGLAAGVNHETKRLTTKYMEKIQGFDLLQEERDAALKEAEKLLQTDEAIDPFEFIGMTPITVYGETPDMFYKRTVHSGNIGVTSLESIERYVDIQLTLPDFNSSLGDTFYV